MGARTAHVIHSASSWVRRATTGTAMLYTTTSPSTSMPVCARGSSSTATASSANAPCNGSHRDRWDCSTGVSMTCAMRAVWHAIGARAST